MRLFFSGISSVATQRNCSFTIFFNIYPATVALALFLTQVAALPQAPLGGPYPSWTPSSLSSTPTTRYSSSLSPYSSPPSKETYPPNHEPDPGHHDPDHGHHELRVTFDSTFDNYTGSLNGVACSYGPNGLAARFPTFGNLPTFPFIGGAFDVSWNSPNCGACWQLNNFVTGVMITITAVDTAAPGFNIAQSAFGILRAEQTELAVICVVANEVPAYFCGL